MKSPFVWFGGKRQIAPMVWERFGDVNNYIEPFAGSLAVLLARPSPPKAETVNDLCGFVTNFWRALRDAPDEVAKWADCPVSELDVHARERWMARQDKFIERMRNDPDFYDPKIAGWWVWGVNLKIGNKWMLELESDSLPDISQSKGIHRTSIRSLPDYLDRLSARLRRVRICCGHWRRVCGSYSTTTRQALTGVFLDPPYSREHTDMDHRYLVETDVRDEVQAWCLEYGGDLQMRIAVCGYDGEYDLPGWDCVAWTARGGFSNQRRDGENVNRTWERVWFSPGCMQVELFKRRA